MPARSRPAQPAAIAAEAVPAKPASPSAPSETWHQLSDDWMNWADRLAPQAEKINRPLIDALNLTSPANTAARHHLLVLDLASGVGEPAFGIARLLARHKTDARGGDNGGCGSSDDEDGEHASENDPAKALTGHVIASDIVPAMCAGLAQRAQAEQLANLDVIAADMQALPFANDIFNAISCRFGVMFCPRPDLALRESYRVLAPSGRAAFMVWGPIGDNPLFSVMQDVLQSILGVGFDQAGLNLFDFADVNASASRMGKAGFDDIVVTSHRPCGRIPHNSAFWRPQMEMLFGPQLRNASPAARDAIDAAIRTKLSHYIKDDHFRVPMCFHIIAGSKGN
ncbi:class I SAM-dependent methyltransferase [Thalassospira mesophila]|uniref:class I SAM-dependent methyltransferase n=1 Tax=Thalassospira mesophila TaxID=1293891 RepID=UPI000A1DC423|nr:methyltransferase domain-containing protein [Thalassospira mesophila]